MKTIDNLSSVQNLWRMKIFAIILYTVTNVICIFIVDLMVEIWASILAVSTIALVLFAIRLKNRNYHFFSFAENATDVTIKFYSVRWFYGAPKMFKIQKRSICDYDLLPQNSRPDELLVIRFKEKGKVWSYPPISISLLQNREKQALKRSLAAICQQNSI